MTDNVYAEIPQSLRYKYRHLGSGVQWGDKIMELPKDKIYDTVVAIMRANPPQTNHTEMLREICKKAKKVNINVGSSNKWNNKNPFKIEERIEMLDLTLKKSCRNYELLQLPDFDNDESWFNHLMKINGGLTEILSNNQGDTKIYQAHQYLPGKPREEENKRYDIITPLDVFPQERMKYVTQIVMDDLPYTLKKPMYASGTFTRAAIVNDWNWEDFVDNPVVEYIKRKGLVEQVKKMCPELVGISLSKIDDGR